MRPEDITAETIAAVIADHPTLTVGGYWTRFFESCTPDGFPMDRALLTEPETVEQVRLCAAWLAGQRWSKGIGVKSPSSYGVKHRVEEWAGRYIYNGAAIVAALILGVPVRPPGWDRPNPALGIVRQRGTWASARDGWVAVPVPEVAA